MGGNSIRVDGNLQIGDVYRLFSGKQGEQLKGRYVGGDKQQFEIYSSTAAKGSGVFSKILQAIKGITSKEKHDLSKQALRIALENSFDKKHGVKIADKVMQHVEDFRKNVGADYFDQGIIQVAERYARDLVADAKAGGQIASIWPDKAQSLQNQASTGSAYPQLDATNPTVVEDEDDDIYDNPADPTNRHYQGTAVTDDVDTDDEDDNVYDLAEDELTDAVEEANDLIDRTRIDLTQPLPSDEDDDDDDDEDMYAVPPDHPDAANQLPDPPRTPPATKENAWSIEDMPDPPTTSLPNKENAWSIEELPDVPTHDTSRTLEDLALRSESSLEARLARLQAGRPRSASAPPNNKVQGMLFADRLERKPEMFSALLKEARARAGSDLLGDGGFRPDSGIKRSDGPAAVAKYFAKHPEPICNMSDQRKHELAVDAVIDFINLPEPPTGPVDK